jgi:hypothetical protein
VTKTRHYRKAGRRQGQRQRVGRAALHRTRRRHGLPRLHFVAWRLEMSGWRGNMTAEPGQPMEHR